ncbi:nucleotide-binding domain-containing protein [Cronobacter sakazakii]|uniref:nucleotide-binding domain-containing protein n=1 Tax=Cronobacter sakazakii TaxID=28141 RepID=UPI0029C9F86F|nr:hypothetical protein [Cronobacter sakazakii]
MNCSDFFYSKINDEFTLHERIKLSKVVLEKGIAKKNELIEFLRQELKESFGCDVKFWLQGSYKSHTLIKPVDKFSSYDIDVGVYLFFDAEDEGVTSTDVKDALKCALLSYCSINNDAKIQDSKNACEGLKFSSFLTIDTPIYYKTETTIKLATDKGWSDSDPKSIQTWLTSRFESNEERSLMKRLVRYFKAWINIKWQGAGFKKIPSLAVNILVANHMKSCVREDDSFVYTALSICAELESSLIVENPLNGHDILTMSQDAEIFAHQKLDELKRFCIASLKADELTKALLFSKLFEHYFPQVSLEAEEGGAGLPALTISPEISVCRYDKDGNHLTTSVMDKIIVNKGDTLTFTICNHSLYNPSSVAQWTVRNIGQQANDANDIGHSVIGEVNESHQRESAYTGSHTMECMITHNGIIIGFKTIEVDVKPARLVKRSTRKLWKK